MRLLAWDTSAKTGAIAALEWPEGARGGLADTRLACEWSLNIEATHSERLLWAIHQTLEAARWRLEDIDVFGVGVGPGSFTGLRIGVTTARTLAHAMKKPLVGVSSLAALARPAALAHSRGENAGKSRAGARARTVVIAATDACKGELFSLWGSARSVADCVALAEGDLPGAWKKGVEEQVGTPESLAKLYRRKLLEGGKEAAWLVVGEGRDRYPELWGSLPRKLRLEHGGAFADQIQGRYVGILAWEGYQAGLARDPLAVHPRYVRAPDAELKLKAGLLPPGPTRGER